MIDSGPTSADRAYIEAMRAEVNWAPFCFDGWSHYEQARPSIPGETIEVIARWPDKGYTLQYRPLLGELTEARQYPIDSFPTITVLGRIDKAGLAQLRSSATTGDDRVLAQCAMDVAAADLTIPTEPPVRTGSSIPDHAEIPVHYQSAEGGSYELEREPHDQPAIAYAEAGRLGLRLGAPVGSTPSGLLVFEPVGSKDRRITLENANTGLGAVRIGVYQYDGLGLWRQAATIHSAEEAVAAIRLPRRPTPCWEEQVLAPARSR